MILILSEMFRIKFFKQSKAKRARRAPSSESEEDDEISEEEDDTELAQPEPPKKKSKSKKDDQKEMTKSIKRVLEKKFNQRKAVFGKHRNIDRSTGREFTVQYAGTAFKITLFKLRPHKPKPKSYDKENQNKDEAVKEEPTSDGSEVITLSVFLKFEKCSNKIKVSKNIFFYETSN